MAIRTEVLRVDNTRLVLRPDVEKGMVMYGAGAQDYPQIPVWLENMMPTAAGLRSMHSLNYVSTPSPALPDPYKSRNLKVVLSVTGQEGLYFTAGIGTRTHYVYFGGNWIPVFSIAEGTATRNVTHATVNGENYTFTSVDGLFGFSNNFAAKVAYAPTAITPGLMRGIASGLDYLIFYDLDTIYWSAPGAPLEFNPVIGAVETGAGSSKIQDLRGYIVAVHPIAGGFLIYSTENIVSARYSGNSLNPWIFNEVRGSGGIYEFQGCIGIGSSAQSHFCWTKSGIQEVNLTAATGIFPDISTYLGSKMNVTSNGSNFTVAELAIESKLANIAFVGNRFICFGVSTTGYASPTVFQSVLIYDVELKRWGRYVGEFVGLFDFSSQVDPLRDKVGVLGIWEPSGTVSLLYLSENYIFSESLEPGYVSHDAILALGRFNITANSVSTLNSVELDGVFTVSKAPVVRDRYRYPNQSSTVVSQAIAPIAGGNMYNVDATGKDHTVFVAGKDMEVHTAKVTMVQRGRL